MLGLGQLGVRWRFRLGETTDSSGKWLPSRRTVRGAPAKPMVVKSLDASPSMMKPRMSADTGRSSSSATWPGSAIRESGRRNEYTDDASRYLPHPAGISRGSVRTGVLIWTDRARAGLTSGLIRRRPRMFHRRVRDRGFHAGWTPANATERPCAVLESVCGFTPTAGSSPTATAQLLVWRMARPGRSPV
jgi:hypothetical protein